MAAGRRLDFVRPGGDGDRVRHVQLRESDAGAERLEVLAALAPPHGGHHLVAPLQELLCELRIPGNPADTLNASMLAAAAQWPSY